MSPHDDDDWVGEPPEGRHPPGTARPEFWRGQRPVMAIGAGIALVIVVLVVAILA